MKRKLIRLLFVFGLITASVHAATYASNGSLADVNAKIAGAATGDTITVPSGTFTWGTGGTWIAVNKAIHLVGLSGATIQLAPNGPFFGGGAIQITAGGATVENLVINGIANTAGGPSSTPISVINCNGWRVTGITFNGPAAPGYFAYCAAAYGLFDHITINGNSGSLQTFMVRGATSVWNNPHTMGTANAVYIEDCTYNGAGYMNENDGAACSVMRFNTINGTQHFDAHQYETSTDASGVQHGSRQVEVYDNLHTASNYNDWCEFSAGTGMVFDNSVTGSIGMWSIIQEWGAHTGAGIKTNGTGHKVTPAYSPIPDQIGMGPYPQSAGAEPFYFFNNTRSNGTDMALIGSAVSTTAIGNYVTTFYMTSEQVSPYMLLKGRDYFTGLSHGTFPSTSGVGRGTHAAMSASSPTAAGQGWWVTDEGSWNTKLAANTSGQLYTWSGSAWVLKYTPYQYPHPLQGVTPTTTTAPSNAVISISSP